LQLQQARNITRSERETFNNWLNTRTATQSPDHNAELLTRTQALDALKATEIAAQKAVQVQEQAKLDTRQQAAATQRQLNNMEDSARVQMQGDQRKQELRVFLYRLALTLPLLVIAGWLFAKKRKSTWWPFVWGFIFFALVAFFVELVPYMPSYGGYVRYIVGIAITVLVGRYSIIALNRYLEAQKKAEALPDQQRRKDLSYDVALGRLAKSACPGCERLVDMRNDKIDFCPHCGICLFNRCGDCNTRKNAFAQFCHSCGTHATGDDSVRHSEAKKALKVAVGADAASTPNTPSASSPHDAHLVATAGGGFGGGVQLPPAGGSTSTGRA
jgi:predicted RNA-binding Zn-ribbon protein involved in translation (DUF1610 family)